jgi:hypothetical protein
MLFDQALLNHEDVFNLNRAEDYPDAVYTNREDTLAAARDFEYPVILIHSWDELKSLENSDLWKAKIIIVPHTVEYIPYS